MRCDIWNERIIGRVYGEIDAADDAELSRHLAGCAACRATLEEFGVIRAMLREHEPPVPQIPKVVVLRDRRGFRPALLAASIVGAALLAGAGAGAGYGWAHRAPRESGASPATVAASPSADEIQELVRREVARRLDAIAAERGPAASQASNTAPSGLTREELRAELAKFERTINGARASDLDYMLDQIAASETRTGNRIGQTNQALRYVALASNPQVSEQ